MFQSVMKSVFGSSNDRYVKSLHKIVAQINALEPDMQALSDDDLRAQTGKLRLRHIFEAPRHTRQPLVLLRDVAGD